MARLTERLTALHLPKLIRKPGFYADGNGLYLQVSKGGASWIYRYMLNGKAREMGLGPLALYGLPQAREKALNARRQRLKVSTRSKRGELRARRRELKRRGRSRSGNAPRPT